MSELYHSLINESSISSTVSLSNNQYIIFIGSKCSKENNYLSETNKVSTSKYSLSDFSFNLNESSIALIKLTNSNFLLCACKKYNRKQANGILIVNLKVLEGETMEYKFYDTGNFEVYCFCQIFGNSAFIFVGGFDLNKRRGIIKIFKVKDENETEIQFLQDIENIEDNNDSPLFDLPVNNIIQTKDSGKIIITTIDGKIYLFSKPNLDFYLKRPKG